VGRWQNSFVGFFVSCVQQGATAKLGRRGVQLARPYLSCRKRQGNKKSSSLHDKMGASAKAAAAAVSE
jgi:hypothetical protein